VGTLALGVVGIAGLVQEPEPLEVAVVDKLVVEVGTWVLEEDMVVRNLADKLRHRPNWLVQSHQSRQS
jgi:hypothetical protein